jgi:hypothetical protein
MRAVESWRAAGGETLDVVPCLNARDDWADAVVELAREAAPWLGGTARATSRSASSA